MGQGIVNKVHCPVLFTNGAPGDGPKVCTERLLVGHAQPEIPIVTCTSIKAVLIDQLRKQFLVRKQEKIILWVVMQMGLQERIPSKHPFCERVHFFILDLVLVKLKGMGPLVNGNA